MSSVADDKMYWMIKIINQDASHAAKYAQNELVVYLAECKITITPVLLCLSGGSAIEILNNFPTEVLGGNVVITVLDERFSIDPKINNMSQIDDSGFLKKALAVGCGLIDTRVEKDETLDDVVARFDLALSQWMQANPKGEIVATAGIGPDGHTSGIIPGSSDFDKLFGDAQERYVVGYVAANQPEIQKTRITTTFTFIKKITFAVMLVLGEWGDLWQRKERSVRRQLGFGVRLAMRHWL